MAQNLRQLVGTELACSTSPVRERGQTLHGTSFRSDRRRAPQVYDAIQTEFPPGIGHSLAKWPTADYETQPDWLSGHLSVLFEVAG